MHLGSELTKSLSSVRLLGVVKFRSRVKRQVNIFGSNFFYLNVKIFSYSFSEKAMNYRVI